MQKACKKFRLWGLMLLAMLFVAGLTTHAASTTEVQAAVKAGFRVVNEKTYYVKSNGKKKKGWLTLNKKKYYFDKKTGVMKTGWMKASKSKRYYFNKKTGVMATGWVKFSKTQRRYFNKKTGVMKTGWLTLNSYKYYLNKKTGLAITGFATDSKKVARYFSPKTGRMAKGWATINNRKYYFHKSTGQMQIGLKKISGKYYYFDRTTGAMTTGWLTNSSGAKRYFDPVTGVMAIGTKTIDGMQYSFKDNGILIVTPSSSVNFQKPSSAKTIKNYLLGAMQPVGQALYVWGGGWNDSTRKGVSPMWKKWYDSQSKSYDYNNYRDLSTANRAKGLDCSGFVGWAAYQVMQQSSGVGSGYTVVASDVGGYYKSLGWGGLVTQSWLSKHNWTLKAGDVGYNSGHTWIVVGQCSDKSAVIVHSTPQAGCQISGTPTPDGNYSSQAITLAKKYMAKFSGYTKYDYHTSSGNYIRNGNYLRWNRNTLADPDGYLNKTADQILADLFR